MKVSLRIKGISSESYLKGFFRDNIRKKPQTGFFQVRDFLYSVNGKSLIDSFFKLLHN